MSAARASAVNASEDVGGVTEQSTNKLCRNVLDTRTFVSISCNEIISQGKRQRLICERINVTVWQVNTSSYDCSLCH